MMIRSNFFVAESLHQDRVEKDVKIKKEHDGTQIATDGVGEAISHLSLTGPVGNDAVNQEAVHIKTEKGIKIEKAGADPATHAVGNAISGLALTGLVQNSHSDTQVTVKTEPGIVSANPPHSLQTQNSLANPQVTFRAILDIKTELVSTPLNRPHGLGYTASGPTLTTSASNYTSTFAGFGIPECGASGAANKVGAAMSRLASNETPALKNEHRSQQEWQARFPLQLPLEIQQRTRSVTTCCHKGTVPRSFILSTTSKAFILPTPRPIGTSGYYKYINGISHFFPLEASPAPKGACICGTFNNESPAAMTAPSFWSKIGGSRITTPLPVGLECGVCTPSPITQAQGGIYNSTPVFHAPSTAPIPAPTCQARNAAHSPAPSFQSQLPVRNSPASNKAQGAAHNPAPYYQAQGPVHSPAHGFQAQGATNRTQPLFRAASYSGTSSGLGFETSPATFDYSARTVPMFNSMNFLRSSTAPVAYGHSFSLPASNTRPLFNPVVYSRPQPPPKVYTFINHTAETMRAQELADKRKSQGLLDVGRTRQGIKDEEEEDIKIKVEPKASCSVPVLERKRTRDEDSDDEKLELERPRKFSG